MPKKTPVIDAVQAEDIFDKKVLTLLKRGESVDEINDQGLNPLMAAASSGDLKTAQVLLTRGARPDQANSAGKCPIVCVAEKKKFDMVKLLLRNKAQPFPALLYTAKTNDTELISKLVRECRISAYSTSFDGNTIKNLLSISRQSPVYKLLTALEMEEDERKRTFDNAKKILMGSSVGPGLPSLRCSKGPARLGPLSMRAQGVHKMLGKRQ
jgi:ankyrin repeat protein